MDSSEIDFSKENIQPLKEGRLTSYLGTALNAQCNIKSQNEILKEREKFELELRKYKGDDPLDIWYNYICWVIQSYPNSGIGHLAPLLHKCLAIFKDDERYLQDIRYVKLWIKYIQMQNDPLETYEMAHKHGIGSKCAEFYKSWAEEYEKVGDYKGASSIFMKGNSFAAQPGSDLAFYQRNFEDRVARRLAQKAEDEWEDSSSGEERRKVLSSLTAQAGGRQHHAVVGSIRIGAAVAGPPGRLKQSTSSFQEQKPSHFQIFSDQSSAESRGRVKMENLPSANVNNRENVLKPGKWTNPNSKMPAYTLEVPHMTPFKVHEDFLSDQGVTTPRGASFSENVLKPRKAVKDDFDCPIVIFEPPDPTKIPMYCKDKVYSGGVEFSLEEIRAIRYYEAEKKKQNELAKGEQYAKSLDIDSEENEESDQPRKMELNQLQEVWSPNEDLLATPVYVTPNNIKSEEHQSEEEIVKRNGTSRSHGGPLQHLDFSSVPSPTINTRRANDMMHELWSTTFTQSLADSIFVLPQQPQSSIPKFEIPFDETAAFQEIPDPEEKAIRIQPQPKLSKFEIHFDEVSVFEHVRNPVDEEIGNNCSKKAADDWGAHIPLVPPPKEDAQVSLLEDDVKENCCPPEYQPSEQTERRALAGILVPSNNIPFQVLDGEGQAVSDQLQQEKDSKECNDVVLLSQRAFSNDIGNTSFEREILNSLTDESIVFDVSKKRRITVSEDRETNTFSGIGNRAVIFKRKHTNRTLETEIKPNSSGNNNWVSQDISNECTNNRFPDKNSIPSTSNCDQQWGITPKVLNSHSSSESGVIDRSEIVKDPCDLTMQETLLTKLLNPACRSNNFYRILQKIPFLKSNDELNLRQGLKLKIQKVISNSANAKFYLAVKEDGDFIVVKCQKVSCEWEFYIIREIRNRLKDSLMVGAFANITEGYLFNADASMLLMEYLQNGTLLDLLNVYKIKQQMFPEVLALYFTVDIINTVRHLHGCSIIHGAIKPENLLVCGLPTISEWNNKCFCDKKPVLQLINLGKCIDMTLFPKNVQFVSSSTEKKFQCSEMQTGQPWTYQADFYNIAFTIHCMLFGEFMDVCCANGVLNIKRKIPVHFNAKMWNNVFYSLINVPSCESLPDLLSMQRQLQEFFLTLKFQEFKSAVSNMKLMLEEEILKKK